MSWKQVFASLITTAVVLAAFNLTVHRLARNSVPRQLITRLNSVSGVTHLALGNSLMAAGFDEKAFDQKLGSHSTRSVNAGLGSTGPVEHLLVLRDEERKNSHLRYVIYGFFDFQLTDDNATQVSDLIGNRAMSYYVEPDIALRFYSMPWSDRIAFYFYRETPMIEDRAQVWAKIELVRRWLSQAGLPARTYDRFGRVADFTALEAASPAQFAERCDALMVQHVGLNSAILEIIRESQGHNAVVVMVEMPMHPSHQSRFYSVPAWGRYRSYLHQLVSREGVVYLNASDWIRDPAEFADNLHMNGVGAEKFSRRLAQFFLQLGDHPLRLVSKKP